MITNQYVVAAQEPIGLVENVGQIVDRLVAACTADGTGIGTSSLLRNALIVAAEAKQRLAEQSERIAHLEALSLMDELTGLYNRRGFNEQLQRALAVAGRLGGTGVLAIIDLDNFKAINDGLGHQAGDAVLCHVAMLLNVNVRATDVVARIGGDEFATILTHTSPDASSHRASALDLLLNRSAVPWGDYEILVHASFGAKTYGTDDGADALIARADAAMYRNKRAKPRVLRPWRPRST